MAYSRARELMKLQATINANPRVDARYRERFAKDIEAACRLESIRYDPAASSRSASAVTPVVVLPKAEPAAAAVTAPTQKSKPTQKTWKPYNPCGSGKTRNASVPAAKPSVQPTQSRAQRALAQWYGTNKGIVR